MVQLLPDESYLIVDTGNNRIIFLNKTFRMVGQIKGEFSRMRFAQLTPSNGLFVADMGNDRVLELQLIKACSL
jgi:hypothetical protein